MGTTLHRYGADAAGDMVDQLREVYAEAYDEPPYNYDQDDVDEFVTRFGRQSPQPGFTLITVEVDGKFAGFSYGYTFEPGKWWRGSRNEPPASIKNVAKFAVIELVVRRAHRGRGLSRLMLEALLQGRTEAWAVLLARPDAMAHAIYRRWGWQSVGTVQSYDDWDADDALVLPLAGRERLPA